MEPEPEKLTDIIAELRAGSLYTLSSTAAFQQGQRLYAAMRVTDFNWQTRDRHLLVEVDEKNADFYLSGSRLQWKCNCETFSRQSGKACEHILAGLMILKTLLNQSQFSRTPLSPIYLQKLQTALTSERDEEPETKAAPGKTPKIPDAVRLTQIHGTLHFADFSRIQSLLESSMREVAEGRHWTAPQKAESLFYDWFTKNKKALPVLVPMADGKLVRVKPHKPVTAEFLAWLQWNEGARVEVWPAFHPTGGKETIRAVPLGETLILLPDTGQIAKINGAPAWSEFRTAFSPTGSRRLFSAINERRFSPTARFESSVQEFNQNFFSLGRLTHQLISRKSLRLGDGSTISSVPQIHRITIADPGEDIEVKVSVETLVSGMPVDIVRILQTAEEYLCESLFGAAGAKSRRRLAVIREAFYGWISLPTPAERGKFIADTIPVLDEIKERSGRIFEKVIKIMEGDLFKHLPGAILAAENDGVPHFFTIGGGLRELGKILHFLLTRCDAELDSMSDHTAFLVPGDQLRLLLPDLHAFCRDHGIKLLWEEHELEAAPLRIRVTATPREGALDWFDLHPEVFCNDVTLTPQEWEKLITGGLLIREGHAPAILDTESNLLVDNLRRLMGRQKKSSNSLRVPRLQILDWIQLARQGMELRLPDAERGVMEALLNFDGLPPVELPSQLIASMRPYQTSGYEWFAFLYNHRFGACLADDMGLGKTLQAIALLGGIHEGKIPRRGAAAQHLIVLPPTLLFNWASELARFYPQLRVREYSGKDRALPGQEECDILLTTYELARRDIEILAARAFDVLIFDEAQAVKNITGGRSQAARRLRAEFRVCLTGTPVENHAGEYHAILDLCLPGLLGDAKEFQAAVKKGESEALLRRAKPFVLRRTKEKILKELPPKVESEIHLDLTDKQREIYTRTVAEVRREVAAAFGGKTRSQAGIVALAALTRLRQVCISPALLDPTYKEIAPKFLHLLDQLRELKDEGHSALVFSQYTRALDALGHSLVKEELPYLRIDGKTPAIRRKEQVEQFQAGEGPGIFLISLKTGGVGLNLTRATYVYHLDPWWNPAVENQASDRAHRIGQTRTVFIHRLLMRHTVEEKIMELKERKKALAEQLLSDGDAGQSASGLITREDMEFLLSTV